MGAKDLFHNAVKVALQKEQWVITDDPKNEVITQWIN
jgi:hypothetical protein